MTPFEIFYLGMAVVSFATFMVTLAFVTWWSGRAETPKQSAQPRAAVQAKAPMSPVGAMPVRLAAPNARGHKRRSK